MEAELTEVQVVENHPQIERKDTFIARGYHYSWKDITYRVNIKKHFWSSVSEEKVILNDICGFVPSGSMMAIMGPSGSGKSTLLDTLAGRIANGLSGDIFVNGIPRDNSDFKQLSAYVMQDDTLQGSLTVKENLMFSANLRLRHLSSLEREAKVDELIDLLGLSRVSSSAVGDPFHRGISGGERRRVSIGMELLTLPSIMFLDEPTSGLDSLSALKVCQLLKKLAQEFHMTIIATIHQPSSSVFSCFDSLLLLSKGKQVYSGELNNAVSYFSKSGYDIPSNTNPADFYSDLINYDFEEEDTKRKVVDELASKYRESEDRKKIIDKIDSTRKEKDESLNGNRRYPANYLVQTYCLLRRTLLVYTKNPAIVHVRVAMYIMMGLMIGSCYWDISDSPASIQDRISAIFFSVAFLTFMSIAAFPALIEDRLLFVRERANAYYQVGPFAIAHSIIQIFGCILMTLGFTLIAYWMMGFQDSGDRFWYYLFGLFTALYIAESLVMVVAAIIPWYLIGIAVAAAMYGLFMLLNGYFVKKTNIPVGWYWAHFLSFQKYIFEGMFYNEFDGRSYECTPIGSFCSCIVPDLNGDCVIESKELLAYYEYENVNKWDWIGYAWIFVIVFRLAFYLALRFLNKTKR